MWHVYILLCKGRFLYTGITTDLKRRLKEHRNKSAKFTSYNPPIRFVHTENYRTRSQASKREAQIKKLKRKAKLALIGSPQ